MKLTDNNNSFLSTTTTILTLVAVLLTISACSSESAGSNEEMAAPVPEPQAVALEVTPTEEPTSTPVDTEESVEPLPADTCVDCHTDKDLLIQTADPEEEVINENEGEG